MQLLLQSAAHIAEKHMHPLDALLDEMPALCTATVQLLRQSLSSCIRHLADACDSFENDCRSMLESELADTGSVALASARRRAQQLRMRHAAQFQPVFSDKTVEFLRRLHLQLIAELTACSTYTLTWANSTPSHVCDCLPAFKVLEDALQTQIADLLCALQAWWGSSTRNLATVLCPPTNGNAIDGTTLDSSPIDTAAVESPPLDVGPISLGVDHDLVHVLFQPCATATEQAINAVLTKVALAKQEASHIDAHCQKLVQQLSSIDTALQHPSYLDEDSLVLAVQTLLQHQSQLDDLPGVLSERAAGAGIQFNADAVHQQLRNAYLHIANGLQYAVLDFASAISSKVEAYLGASLVALKRDTTSIDDVLSRLRCLIDCLQRWPQVDEDYSQAIRAQDLLSQLNIDAPIELKGRLAHLGVQYHQTRALMDDNVADRNNLSQLGRFHVQQQAAVKIPTVGHICAKIQPCSMPLRCCSWMRS